MPCLDLCVAVVDYLTPWGRRKQGVASTWLASLKPGDFVPLLIQRGTLPAVATSAAPLVMVGPGTGVASMRAVVQERTALLAGSSRLNAATPHQLGPATLYFGCRHAKQDWLYAEDMRTARVSGSLARYCVAFSRDDPSRVVYVQGLMARERDSAELFHALVHEQGTLYIAGSAKRMPGDVVDTLKGILVAVGGATRSEADAYVAAMERDHRLVIEAWA